MFYSVWKSYKTQSIQPRFPSEPSPGRLRWVILIIDFLRREWGKRKENIYFVNRNRNKAVFCNNNKMRHKKCPLCQDMALYHKTWEPVIIIGYRHGLESHTKCTFLCLMPSFTLSRNQLLSHKYIHGFGKQSSQYETLMSLGQSAISK